jgi:hypothetical protein
MAMVVRGHEMLVTFDELPKSPEHVFYDRLQTVLADAGFDAFVEALCQPYYAAVMGAVAAARALLPHAPGRVFRGLDSKRGLEWRCADSLSLRGLPRARAARAGARPFVAQSEPGAAAAEDPRARCSPGCWRASPSADWSRTSARLAPRADVGGRPGAARALTPPPWKRTPRCARSGGATAARATARCSRGWPRTAGSRPRPRPSSSSSIASARARG